MIPRMKTSWWTYDEILDYPQSPAFRPDGPNSSTTPNDWFKKILTDRDLKYNMVGIDTSNTALVSAIPSIIEDLMNIVYNRHYKDYLFEKTSNWNDIVNLTEDDYCEAIGKILNVIDLTLPRYIPILMANKVASNDVLKPMQSSTTGTNRFNDTPQDGGDYSDDNHSTNVSQSSSTTTADSGSLAQRLDEIFKNYRSIILEWSNEFNQLFLKEEQI